MKIVDMSVEYVDHMGTDLSVVNAARVSFNKQSDWEQYAIEGDEYSTRLSERDVKLINYLAKHNHWTPFAHTSVSLRCKAPIFVARQMVKHQVGLVWSEVSRRYVDDEPEFWFPREWRGKPVNAKQGSSDDIKTVIYLESQQKYDDPTDASEKVVAAALQLYNDLIAADVAPEQARMVLPQNTMTEWLWTGSLAAFSRVCRLRLDPHTQLESQELAEGIRRVVAPLFPVSWQALIETH